MQYQIGIECREQEIHSHDKLSILLKWTVSACSCRLSDENNFFYIYRRVINVFVYTEYLSVCMRVSFWMS